MVSIFTLCLWGNKKPSKMSTIKMPPIVFHEDGTVTYRRWDGYIRRAYLNEYRGVTVGTSESGQCFRFTVNDKENGDYIPVVWDAKLLELVDMEGGKDA